MPDKKTVEKAEQDKREGKSASTQAGEFVHDEIEHIREGKHGVRSAKQAIAIGLSEARRAGVDIPPPAKGTTSDATRRKAAADSAKGKSKAKATVSRKRSQATTKALQREGSSSVSHESLSRHAKSVARKRK